MEWYGGYQVQSESGVDLTLIRSRLARPVEDRLKSNLRMIRFCAELRKSNPQFVDTRGEATMAELDAKGLTNLLMENHVEFVLLGGLAMIYHGSAHITLDMDICYNRTASNIQALAHALAPAHPYLRGVPPGLPFKFDAPTIQAGLNFTLDTDLGPLDLLGEVSGLGFYQEVLAQSAQGLFAGFTLPVLSIDGLIASKKAAGRPKDQGHVLELIEIKKIVEEKK